jgi:hypothetical protein
MAAVMAMVKESGALPSFRMTSARMPSARMPSPRTGRVSSPGSR